MQYNWQQNSWPHFTFDAGALDALLLAFSERAGRVSGLMAGLGDEEQSDAMLELIVAEAIKTSAIEGEHVGRDDVMSSVRNNLGLGDGRISKDIKARGVADMMTTARTGFAEPLSDAMLFDWHEKLMLGERHLNVGAWRDHDAPMQVVSGPIGKEKVHFEAPPSKQVSEMMAGFITWFNETGGKENQLAAKAPIRSGLAHLYFESIHPFEDGNGRIGRAISEKALSQGVGQPVILSLSQRIEANRNDYYDALKASQNSNEVTPWLEYFLQLCLDAQIDAERQIEFTLKKAQFFDRHQAQLNDRQTKVLARMFAEGPEGFEGGMSAKKYIKIADTSKPTATRDLQALSDMGALQVTGGGRSTRYRLAL